MKVLGVVVLCAAAVVAVPAADHGEEHTAPHVRRPLVCKDGSFPECPGACEDGTSPNFQGNFLSENTHS